MSSSPSVPVATITSAPKTSVAPSAIGLELMDAKGSSVDSSIPANASVDTSLDINSNILSTSTFSHNVYPISTPLEHGAQQPRSSPEDISVIQESLGSLKLVNNHITLNGGEIFSQNGAPNPASGREASMNAPKLHSELETVSIPVPGTSTRPSGSLKNPRPQYTVSIQQEGSAPPRLISRSSDTGSYSKCSIISDGIDSSPVIVVSSQSQSPEPFAEQLQPGLPILIDEPDERLLNALETPRDRLFVIKLEKDVINFIQENTCEIFDLPPINAYHRLLAHKMAEYYRLTHVADSTGASVRYYRGQYARIPPVRLADKGTLLQNPANTGTAPTMKIMQRRSRSEKGTRTPPDHSDSTPKKPSSETSSGDGSSRTTSREEREAAYERARARIFKDFVSSPPETPPPTKPNDKQRKQAQPDDFSGRSQFFPVLAPPPPPVSQHYYPQYESPTLQFQNNTHMPVAPRFNPNTPSFNPNVNFAPQPFMNSMPNRQFQPQPDRSFPPVNQSQVSSMYPQQQQHHQQPQQQQQLRNVFYDPTMNFNNGHLQQQHAPMITPSFTNASRFIPQQSPYLQQHHQQPMPPPLASGNRHPYISPSNYAVSGVNNMPPQRFPQSYIPGWSTPQTGPPNAMGGVPMGATRSQPPMGSFDRHSPPFGGMPYQSHHHGQHQHHHAPQQQPWAGGGQTAANGFGRGGFGGGAGGSMHGPVGGM